MAKDIKQEWMSHLENDLKTLSDRLSQKVWTVSLGVITFSAAFILSNDTDTKPLLETSDVIAPTLLCIIALIFDLWQYIVGYLYSYKLHRQNEKTETIIRYKKRHPLYIARDVFFWGKIFFCFLGAAFLVKIVYWKIYWA